jgi:hypothetical protein
LKLNSTVGGVDFWIFFSYFQGVTNEFVLAIEFFDQSAKEFFFNLKIENLVNPKIDSYCSIDKQIRAQKI